MKKTLFADISLLLVTFVWGATFVVVQNAIASLPPHSFNAVRFLLATLLLGGWLILFERKQLSHLNRKLLFSGVIMGVWLFVGYAFQTVGLLYTTSSKAGFITGLCAVMVPLLSIILLKQRPSKNAVIGVVIATVGLYMLTMTDMTALNKGDVLVFFCAIGFAMHIIFTGKYSSKYPSLLLTVIQIATVTICSFMFSLITEDYMTAFSPSVLFRSEVIFALLVTAVFATALAFFAQTNFQKFTTPTRVALIFAMEPVFAAATAYLWINERLSTSALIGCLLILAGMLFAELPMGKGFLLKKIKQRKKAV
ncbi:DMT family transporter [Bacillus sp. 31A1R]|uniref:DMT family transporter n=1 Tax=Robertmurraya mangrovi TaxID=3098077 RepID=A0ABU5J184_9BACI|nr:DMT family transporter [Bacillus sp. 31A1R]MDZ5473180.1 DMT family transporter [Bacillus sp. 31A1R]